ncbi:hypothetical protein QYE76_038771 [Lolium multiflorum]|uniref:Ribonuclease H1 N-terminal domain-containing protein n=1 Tax=Lolium multiflorum TaxID=4521 RepID=A0AAD8T9L2_LOLMU|nr:hypothetical protein QYE76_038771 [Lolium multiflorum]
MAVETAVEMAAGASAVGVRTRNLSPEWSFAMARSGRVSRIVVSFRDMTWYVVYKGKVPGVYNDWEECRR